MENELDDIEKAFYKLQDFEFESDDEEEDSTGKVAFLKKCDEFDFFMFPVQPIVSKLHMKVLNIPHCGLGDKGTIALAEALMVNKTIESVILKDNWITPIGIEKLFEALMVNKSVTLLDISDNQAGIKRSNKRFGDLIVSLLTINTSLSTLVLRGNKLGNSDVIKMCEYMSDDQHIRSLDLSFNNIEPFAGKSIQDMLDNNGYLKEFNLQWNSLRDEGSRYVLDGLKSNNVLESINLGWCGLSDKCAFDISSILQDNTSLIELNLKHNRIRKEGVLNIANALKENTSIQKLNLSENPIGKEGVLFLFNILLSNHTLTDLVIDKVGETYKDSMLLTQVFNRLSEIRDSTETTEGIPLEVDIDQLVQDCLKELCETQKWEFIVGPDEKIHLL